MVQCKNQTGSYALNAGTRTKLRADTVVDNFPLYCPKCKRESLISAKKFKVRAIKEETIESQTQ